MAHTPRVAYAEAMLVTTLVSAAIVIVAALTSVLMFPACGQRRLSRHS
ncbi:MAG: hypothetical protein NVV63_11670 [Opitutus sp.]|nr:hypothetical protein [Opitutus sp.]